MKMFERFCINRQKELKKYGNINKKAVFEARKDIREARKA